MGNNYKRKTVGKRSGRSDNVITFSKVLNVTITPDMKKELEELSKAWGVSINAITRQALESLIETYRPLGRTN